MVGLRALQASESERALEDLNHAPALVARERTALLDEDAVADLGVVLLVVRLVALTALDVLVIDGVTHAARDLDHDGLGHLVAGDQPDHRLLVALGRHLRVPYFLPDSFCERIVLARASSRRDLLSFEASWSCAVACWKRTRK